ncbi:MAG: hypothetical protein ABIZ56_04370 [Chthoniobacteraceae bacterium]
MFVPEIACAQEKANQGNLNVGGRRQVFKNVVAVRGKSQGENRIMVLATGQPVTAGVLKKVKDKDAEEMDGEWGQPYLKAVFLEDGSLQCLVGMGAGSGFLERGSAVEGKATVADGRIRGAAKLIKTGDFAKEVTLNFDVPIDAEMKVAGPAKLDPPVKPTVSGKFVGNGKNAAVKFVTVGEHEAFSGKEAITLIFTEKDPATARKPSFDAAFGKLGSALILNVHHDGGIFGCQVVHSAHTKQGFSALGQIHMVEFEIGGGNVTGQVSTGKMLDTFGEKWEVDLKFAAPLPEKLRNAPAVVEKPAASAPRESSRKEPKAATGPVIAARKLALPKDATDVQYKQLVQHIQFSSGQGVAAVAGEFSSKLKQQGWKESGRDLMGKPNAILKREQGDAKLTIMIQPAAAGSVVKVFTEGLDWSDGDEGKPAAKSKPSDADDDKDDIEKQADKLLKDALKQLPKGF